MGRVAIISLVSRSLPIEEEPSEDQEELLRRLLQDLVSEGDILRSWRLDHVKVLEDADTL
jgi:hypothetical protein